MLRVWLPLTKDTRNQGLADVNSVNVQSGCSIDSNGKLGKCYTNSGTATNVGNSVVFSASKFSACAWVRLNTRRDNWTRAFGMSGNGTYFGLGCEHTNGTLLGFHYYKTIDGTNTAVFDTYPISVSTGVWNHFVMCYDGIKYYIYQNGSLVDSGNARQANIDCNMTTLYLFGGTANTYSQCSLNDVRIYDHCLSPMEVKKLSQGLVLHYPLDNNGLGQENLAIGTDVASSTNGKMYNLSSTIPSGTKVTISCWVDADNIVLTGNKRIGLSYGITRSDGSGKQWFETWASYGSGQLKDNGSFHGRISNTQMILGDMPAIDTYIQNLSSGTVSISQIKVEIGDHPTPWCPNKNDALYSSMGMNDGIEYDCSGFCNNGTRVGALTYSSDAPKYVVSTKITPNSNIQFIPMLAGAYNWTIAAWIKPAVANNDGKAWFSVEQNTYWQVTCYSNQLTIRDNSIGGTGSRKSYSFGTIVANTWIHLVATYDNGTLKLYNNGVLQNTHIVGGTYLNAMNNGRWGSAVENGYYWNGQITDARIYVTALSADDVKSLYQNSAYIDSSGNVYGAVHMEA